MCLAVPMKVTSVAGDLGRVEQAGLTRQVSFALLDRVEPGDYVLVHAGFAIERLEPAEAAATLELLAAVVSAGPAAPADP